jgi:hypothetical protein
MAKQIGSKHVHKPILSLFILLYDYTFPSGEHVYALTVDENAHINLSVIVLC